MYSEGAGTQHSWLLDKHAELTVLAMSGSAFSLQQYSQQQCLHWRFVPAGLVLPTVFTEPLCWLQRARATEAWPADGTNWSWTRTFSFWNRETDSSHCLCLSLDTSNRSWHVSRCKRAKKYSVSHKGCTLSYLKRWVRSVMKVKSERKNEKNKSRKSCLSNFCRCFF